jgi:WXG100 family type VII secretion target
MPHKLQIQYDDMDNIAKMFDTYADNTQEMIQKLDHCVSSLQGGGWKGVGGEKFYDEMESEVMPKLKLLQQGYETAGAQIKRMSQMFQDAEQRILSFFASI